MKLCPLHGEPIGPAPATNCPQCRSDIERTLVVDATGHPYVWHITNGRDHDGTEWMLCGIRASWGADKMQPVHPDKWCERCIELDG